MQFRFYRVGSLIIWVILKAVFLLIIIFLVSYRRFSHCTCLIEYDSFQFIYRFQNITFLRSRAAADHHPIVSHSSGLVQIVLFEAADRDNIGGSPYGGQRSICCTPDLAKLEGCKQGEVIRIPSANDNNWPVVLNVHFSGRHMATHLKNTQIQITKTGMYNLFFISCDPELKGMTLSGRTVWKNPDGYLPGRMAPLMKFYVIMSLAYVLLCVIWFVQYVRFSNDVLHLQHWITIVIALGLFETSLWYFEYAHFNNTGTRPVGITTWVVTIGAIRKTLTRLLILCVSMGYGVVRPTLGGFTAKVMLLGFTYFLASELLNITEYVGTINDISGRARVFLVLPEALLDAFLILWIFTSLSKTLEQLQVLLYSIACSIVYQYIDIRLTRRSKIIHLVHPFCSSTKLLSRPGEEKFCQVRYIQEIFKCLGSHCYCFGFLDRIRGMCLWTYIHNTCL